MAEEHDVTLPYEREKKLPNGHTILTVRIRDLPRIVDHLERLTFSDEQETFSINWVPRESMKDPRWDEVEESDKQHPLWEAELGVGVWDTWTGVKPRATNHRS